jgi:hypothetical protein
MPFHPAAFCAKQAGVIAARDTEGRLETWSAFTAQESERFHRGEQRRKKPGLIRCDFPERWIKSPISESP